MLSSSWNQILFTPDTENQVGTTQGHQSSFSIHPIQVEFHATFFMMTCPSLCYLNTSAKKILSVLKWHCFGWCSFCLKGVVWHWKVHSRQQWAKDVWMIPTISSGKSNRTGQRNMLFSVSVADFFFLAVCCRVTCAFPVWGLEVQAHIKLKKAFIKKFGFFLQRSQLH